MPCSRSGISAIVLFSSCKKEDTIAPPPALTVLGTWEGTYRATNSPTTNYFGFVLNQDETMSIKIKADAGFTASGTWTKTDNTFNATYKYNGSNVNYFLTAKTNLTDGTMNGSYASGTEGNTVGEYNMVKK